MNALAHGGCNPWERGTAPDQPGPVGETDPMKYANTITLALGLLLPLTACDLDALPDSDRAAITTSEDDARRDHRPPPLMLLELAVDRGDLQDDAVMREALDAMQSAHAEALGARTDLQQALADAVEAKAVTSEGFAAQLAAITQAAHTEGLTLTAALDTAHELLDAELRAEVVESLPEPPPRGERPAGERPAGERPAGERPSGDAPHGPGPDHGPMALLETLELDDGQREALRDALGEPARPPRPEPLDLASFADDDFDATTLGLAGVHTTHVTEQATRHIELLVALVPLLDDDQRTTLADLLREAPRGPTRTARG